MISSSTHFQRYMCESCKLNRSLAASLCPFSSPRKAPFSFFISDRQSVWPHLSAKLPLDGFKRNLVLRTFVKTYRDVLINVQRDASQSILFIILQVHSTCFGCQPHPSSGVHKIITTTSDSGHIFCAATSLKRGQAWPRWREAAAQYRRL